MVQAIFYSVSSLATALSGGDPGSPDTVNDLLSELKTLLLPSMANEKEDKAEKVKRIMERELSAGPFKVEAMVYEKKGKGLN